MLMFVVVFCAIVREFVVRQVIVIRGWTTTGKPVGGGAAERQGGRCRR